MKLVKILNKYVDLKKRVNMELNLGAQLPEFELKNQDGELVQIKDFLGNPLVIYFYPKDNTPGCTKQACSFRDSYEELKKLDFTVFGVSGDDIASHKAFKEKHQLPFQLLADEGNKVRTLFGVPTNLFGKIPGRVTYIFDKTGSLVKSFIWEL